MAINVNYYSQTAFKLTLRFGDELGGIGTGFIYCAQDGKPYLITNWHVVTGRHAETGKCLSKTGLVPDRLIFSLRQLSHKASNYPVTIRLKKDEDEDQRVWLIHPNYGRKIDVVAIPVEVGAHQEMAAVNSHSSDDVGICEGDDVFVLGFPKGLSGEADFPIWKRGSIASIPEMDQGGLPRMLIDTATREGMSGAPVILRPPLWRYKWPNNRDPLPRTPQLDRFIGVYSGRLGVSEFEAQLGIVWRAQVIDEIITAQRFGRPND